MLLTLRDSAEEYMRGISRYTIDLPNRILQRYQALKRIIIYIRGQNEFGDFLE